MSNRASIESVYAALFNLLSGITDLQTMDRRLRNIQDVDAQDMPAIFQTQGKQKNVYKGTVPIVQSLEANWILYTNEQDVTAPPSTRINNLIDEARAVLAPAPGFKTQTLGGLVEYAAISGDIEVFEGVLGDKAVAIIPITLVLPGF